MPLGIASAAAQARVPVLVVSRKRLLNDTDIAKALLKAEIALTAELQRRVDAIKTDLNAQEQELTRLRATLPRPEFDKRVQAFDHKVRTERRRMQRHAAALQNAFRSARVKLTDQLDPVLEQVRVEHGAGVILNSDMALAVDPSVDITDEVIQRVNETVPMPEIPTLKSLDMAPESPPDPSVPQAGTGQGADVSGAPDTSPETGSGAAGQRGSAGNTGATVTAPKK